MNFTEKASRLRLILSQRNILVPLRVCFQNSQQLSPSFLYRSLPPPGHCRALGAHDSTSKALRTEFNPNDYLYHQETITFFVKSDQYWKLRAYEKKRTTSCLKTDHSNLISNSLVFRYTRTVADYSLLISKKRLSSVQNQKLGQLYFRVFRFLDKQLNLPL